MPPGAPRSLPTPEPAARRPNPDRLRCQTSRPGVIRAITSPARGGPAAAHHTGARRIAPRRSRPGWQGEAGRDRRAWPQDNRTERERLSLQLSVASSQVHDPYYDPVTFRGGPSMRVKSAEFVEACERAQAHRLRVQSPPGATARRTRAPDRSVPCRWEHHPMPSALRGPGGAAPAASSARLTVRP
jgi:hypothetical protein